MLKVKRPTILTLICILCFLQFLVLFALIASPEIKRMGAIYPAIFGAITALQFISIVGVWYMKKWGVNLFVSCFFIKMTVLILLKDYGIGTWIGVVFSVLYIIGFLSFYRQMDENL